MFNSNSDPFVNALKSFGYNIVRLPKADIQPLQMLSKNGDNLERLGAMTKLLKVGDNIPVPTISTNTPTAPINGSRTSELKIGLGLSILGNIIGALGGSSLGLDLEYQKAKTAVFEFQEVLEDKIELIDLDQYLGEADINPASVFVSKLLESDKLFITTATIKSTKFNFEAKSDSGTTLSLNVPVIQQAVGGNVKVSSSNQSNSKLTYEGKIPLIFGFQAVQVFYDNGKYTAFKPISGVAMKAIPIEVNTDVEYYTADNTLIRLGDLG